MNCLFSGLKADTKEHVIPMWLQKRMSLTDKTLLLPNNTELKYKHVVVPAHKKHNEKFATIEERISNGIFNINEVYLWALKIHVGLLVRDSTLKIDIKKPDSNFILNINNISSELNLFRMLYEIWSNGGTFEPNPFGSVFIIDSVTPYNQFDLLHCPITKTIGIDIGDKFILVLLWDKQRTMSSNVLEEWYNYRLPNLKKLNQSLNYEDHCFMVLRVFACETAYFSFLHQSAKISFIKTKNSIALLPSFNGDLKKDFNDDEYKFICRNFGLKRIIESSLGKYVYTQLKIKN